MNAVTAEASSSPNDQLPPFSSNAQYTFPPETTELGVETSRCCALATQSTRAPVTVATCVSIAILRPHLIALESTAPPSIHRLTHR